jgi:hypothetical protein
MKSLVWIALALFLAYGCVTSSDQQYEDPNYKILDRDSNIPREMDISGYLSRFQAILLPNTPNTGITAFSGCSEPIKVKEPNSAPSYLNVVYLAITTTTGQTGRCSGIFVQDNVIATAAHCFSPGGPMSIKSVGTFPGVHINKSESLVLNGKGYDFAYSIRYNGKFQQKNPLIITPEESKEDYAFIILPDDTLWNSINSKVLPQFVEPEYATTGGIAGGTPIGKKYGSLGYSSIDNRIVPLWSFEPTFVSKLTSYVLTTQQRTAPGHSGGALLNFESGNTSGLLSGGNRTQCTSNYVVPHEELLKLFNEVSKIASCVKASTSSCERNFCSRLGSGYPDGSITQCSSNCKLL